jgi:hypothetical protein
MNAENKVENFNEALAYESITRAIRTGIIIALVALPLCWWKIGWPGVVAEILGALIALSGLREWRRLMQVMLARMEERGPDAPKPRAVGPVVAGFILRLIVAIALLYVSLKYLPGSVVETAIALSIGLATGVLALTIEALRLLKTWTE